MGDLELKRKWLDRLRPGAVSRLFDYLPHTLYFAKDRELRLMAGNRAFVARCGFSSEEEMLGRRDHEIFPMEMAEKYQADDLNVIRSDEPLVEIVELFPNRLCEPEWFITDKIPLHYQTGEVAGVCGKVRSFEGVRSSLQPYLDLLPVTEYLKNRNNHLVLSASIGQVSVPIPNVAFIHNFSLHHTSRFSDFWHSLTT